MGKFYTQSDIKRNSSIKSLPYSKSCQWYWYSKNIHAHQEEQNSKKTKTNPLNTFEQVFGMRAKP